MAAALAVDSCCPMMIWARPSKPPARRRNGGRPVRATIGAQRGSSATSAAMALSRSVSV